MKQTKESIKKEIRKLQSYHKITKDVIELRICYLVSEILRWSIEDTIDWDKPLEQVLINIKILKQEINARFG